MPDDLERQFVDTNLLFYAPRPFIKNNTFIY